ncbi:MAG TPA: hypothetical protein VGM94_12710 [Galbitalea sp.]|jgi:hypothetical protein
MSSVHRARVRPDPRHGYRPGTLLGVLSAFASVLTIVLVSVGITQSMLGQFETGTSLAYFSVGTSVVGVLGGIAAIVLDRGRGWGVIAIILGLAADPLILTRVLDWIGGLG